MTPVGHTDRTSPHIDTNMGDASAAKREVSDATMDLIWSHDQFPGRESAAVLRSHDHAQEGHPRKFDIGIWNHAPRYAVEGGSVGIVTMAPRRSVDRVSGQIARDGRYCVSHPSWLWTSTFRRVG